ncbi:unnamed protein product [Orchesella dallaii]|uniref:CCHC-type domain-containing protein n=1 Tax=Orchesella dallaii TaxID=48710 RepID=A0ABP1PVE5_9HEXA
MDITIPSAWGLYVFPVLFVVLFHYLLIWIDYINRYLKNKFTTWYTQQPVIPHPSIRPTPATPTTTQAVGNPLLKLSDQLKKTITDVHTLAAQLRVEINNVGQHSPEFTEHVSSKLAKRLIQAITDLQHMWTTTEKLQQDFEDPCRDYVHTKQQIHTDLVNIQTFEQLMEDIFVGDKIEVSFVEKILPMIQHRLQHTPSAPPANSPNRTNYLSATPPNLRVARGETPAPRTQPRFTRSALHSGNAHQYPNNHQHKKTPPSSRPPSPNTEGKREPSTHKHVKHPPPKDQQQLQCKRCGKTNHKTDDCRFNNHRINNIAVDEDRQSPPPSSPVPDPNDGASSDDEHQSTFMGSFAIFNNNNKNDPLPMIPVNLPGTENNKHVQVSSKCLVEDTTPIQKYQFEIAKEPVGKIRSLQVLHDWPKAKITEILQQIPTVVDSPILGHTDVIQHEINVKEDKPKLQRPCPVYGRTHNKWADNIPLFQLAINSSRHEITGYSPAHILFNQEPRLQLDNTIAADTSDSDDHDDENLILLSRYSTFQKIIHDVKSNLSQAQAKQKAPYDQHRQPTSLKMDDIVVIRNTTLSNTDKKIVKGLCPLYSSTPGRITKINHDLTYEVTFQDGTTRGPLHADMLRLYHPRDDATAATPAAIPMVDPSSSEEDSPPVPRQLRQRKVRLNYRDLHLGRTTST